MKKFYILLIAVFMASGARAQWFPQNSGTDLYLYSVYFTDVNIGYAVGDSGTILKTIDGGVNWIEQGSGTTENLSAVHFPSADSGYVISQNKIILKTIDAGINWIQQIVDSTFFPHSVFFISPYTGYIVGSSTLPWWEASGIIMKTIDGGNSWTANFTYPHYHLEYVCFPSDNTGYVLGESFGADPTGIILRTSNGGAEWDDTLLYRTPRSLCMLTVDTGFAVDGTVILKTTDGWKNWTEQSFEWGWNSINFTSTDIGYGIGVSDLTWDNIILKTIDGGINWHLQDSSISFTPYSIYFPSVDTGYIVGENGMILKTTNGGGNPVGINDNNFIAPILTVYPNPTSTQITISTPTTPNKNTILTIYNVSGQQLLTQWVTQLQTVVDVAELPQGVYFVRVVDEKCVMVGKFVKH